MRQRDVKIGGTYLAKVGQDLVKVHVIELVDRSSYSQKTAFRVKRVDNGLRLRKLRTAAALKEISQ